MSNVPVRVSMVYLHLHTDKSLRPSGNENLSPKWGGLMGRIASVYHHSKKRGNKNPEVYAMPVPIYSPIKGCKILTLPLVSPIKRARVLEVQSEPAATCASSFMRLLSSNSDTACGKMRDCYVSGIRIRTQEVKAPISTP